MNTKAKIADFCKRFHVWLYPLLCLMAAVFFRNFAPGFGFTALIFSALAVLLCVYNLLGIYIKHNEKVGKILRRILTACVCIGLTVVTVTGILVVKASFGQPEKECGYVIVLGAKVNGHAPSVTLAERINAAYAYLQKNPDTVCIVSGGKGDGENISEAQCMYESLVEKGIDPQRIWMEDKAVSTWENLHFSLRMIQEKTGSRPEKVAIVSSEYHLFRAGLFADECGVESVGIPAKTAWVSLRINYFLREIAGVWHYLILGGQYHD